MRNIYDVIREKEAAVEQLQKELEALRIAARLLTDDSNGKRDREPVPVPVSTVRPTMTRPNTDTEVMLSAPLRQFP